MLNVSSVFRFGGWKQGSETKKRSEKQKEFPIEVLYGFFSHCLWWYMCFSLGAQWFCLYVCVCFIAYRMSDSVVISLPLLRLHVDDLGDASLHDEEVGIVHVQQHRMEPERLSLSHRPKARWQALGNPYPSTPKEKRLSYISGNGTKARTADSIAFVYLSPTDTNVSWHSFGSTLVTATRPKSQILNLILLHVVRVQEISISTSDHNLSRDDDLVVHLVPHVKFCIPSSCKVNEPDFHPFPSWTRKLKKAEAVLLIILLLLQLLALFVFRTGQGTQQGCSACPHCWRQSLHWPSSLQPVPACKRAPRGFRRGPASGWRCPARSKSRPRCSTFRFRSDLEATRVSSDDHEVPRKRSANEHWTSAKSSQTL